MSFFKCEETDGDGEEIRKKLVSSTWCYLTFKNFFRQTLASFPHLSSERERGRKGEWDIIRTALATQKRQKQKTVPANKTDKKSDFFFFVFFYFPLTHKNLSVFFLEELRSKDVAACSILAETFASDNCWGTRTLGDFFAFSHTETMTTAKATTTTMMMTTTTLTKATPIRDLSADPRNLNSFIHCR